MWSSTRDGLDDPGGVPDLDHAVDRIHVGDHSGYGGPYRHGSGIVDGRDIGPGRRRPGQAYGKKDGPESTPLSHCYHK